MLFNTCSGALRHGGRRPRDEPRGPGAARTEDGGERDPGLGTDVTDVTDGGIGSHLNSMQLSQLIR